MRIIVSVVALGLASYAFAQDTPEFPKPQKEHSLLKQFEGDWDAHGRMFGQMTKEGKAYPESKGRETAKMGYGGFWLAFEFNGEMHDRAYQGHGAMGYDPYKKKYQIVWIDSFNPRLMTAEGDADASGKTFTFHTTCVDPVSKEPLQETLVLQVKDADFWTMTMTFVGAEDKTHKGMTIEYTRHKS
jgi:hypothetical protein